MKASSPCLPLFSPSRYWVDMTRHPETFDRDFCPTKNSRDEVYSMRWQVLNQYPIPPRPCKWAPYSVWLRPQDSAHKWHIPYETEYVLQEVRRNMKVLPIKPVERGQSILRLKTISAFSELLGCMYHRSGTSACYMSLSEIR